MVAMTNDIDDFDEKLQRVLSTRMLATIAIAPYVVDLGQLSYPHILEIQDWITDHAAELATVRQYQKVSGTIEYRFENESDYVQFMLRWK